MNTKLTRKPLATVTTVGGRRMVKTTICIPERLRPFVLRESGKPFPGSSKPMGISAYITKLIEAARSAFSRPNDRTLSR